MNELIKKIHMYLGLMNFSILLVFGITGLAVTVAGSPESRTRPEPRVEHVDFVPPGNVDDRQLAEAVYQRLQLPLAAPVPTFALRRDSENNLALDFYTVNGVTRAVVLEKEKRIRLEARRNSFWQYLNNLHATTRVRIPDWRLKAWSWYVEFAIWSLLAMPLSGAYLWLSSRPAYRWAQLALASGCGAFVVLYVLTR